MGRHPQPEIKRQPLDACTDYALEHGLSDRLEPLGNAAGASPRMLIYHLGSRDQLLRAILDRARQRQLEMFGDLLRAQLDEPYPATLSRAWAVMTGPQGRPELATGPSQQRQRLPGNLRGSCSDAAEVVARRGSISFSGRDLVRC